MKRVQKGKFTLICTLFACQDMQEKIKIPFCCRGNILKNSKKVSKINDFMERKGTYYTVFERALSGQTYQKECNKKSFRIIM